jgi:hypothetical protein
MWPVATSPLATRALMQGKSALAAHAAERSHFDLVAMLFIAAIGASCARDGVDRDRRGSGDQRRL